RPEVDAAFGDLDRVMPAMHLRAVEEALQPPRADVDVGMNVHPPRRVDDLLEHDHLRTSAEEYDGSELHRLIDQDLERVGSGAREPVHVFGGVVRLVDAPEVLVVVLPAMKPVDVEIVHHEEEQHLQAEWPASDQMEP